jgi:hypothetical protein
MRLRISALFLSVALSTVAASAQSNQAITGTVTDAMCGAHHMMQGKTPRTMHRECVRQGSDFALASGDKVYILKGDKSQFDKLAGQCDHQGKDRWADNHGRFDRGCQVLISIYLSGFSSIHSSHPGVRVAPRRSGWAMPGELLLSPPNKCARRRQ